MKRGSPSLLSRGAKVASYLTPDYRRASFYIFAMILAENRRGAKEKQRGGRNMDNYEKIGRVSFDLQSIGIKAGTKGRFTNRLIKRIDQNRVIIESMKDDKDLKPLVSRMLKIISLWNEFATAFNSRDEVEGERLSKEIWRLSGEILSLLERRKK
jgi:hypothetical protein